MRIKWIALLVVVMLLVMGMSECDWKEGGDTSELPTQIRGLPTAPPLSATPTAEDTLIPPYLVTPTDRPVTIPPFVLTGTEASPTAFIFVPSTFVGPLFPDPPRWTETPVN